MAPTAVEAAVAVAMPAVSNRMTDRSPALSIHIRRTKLLMVLAQLANATLVGKGVTREARKALWDGAKNHNEHAGATATASHSGRQGAEAQMPLEPGLTFLTRPLPRGPNT